MGLTRPRAEQIFNLDYKQATRAVTTTDVTLAGGAPAQVDGVALSINDRILVTGQATASQNGLYLVTTVGSGSNGTWIRTTDGNETGEIDAGMIVMVTEGAVYADTQWKLITDNPIQIGITPLVWAINILSTVGGGNTQVQYNSSGVLGGSTNFTFDGSNVTVTGNITGSYILGNGSQLTGLPATYGDSNVVTLLASFGSNSISTTGNVTAKNLNSSNADLAEMYVADADYPPGIVVEFGGDSEITIARVSHSTAVAGITSTNPSYLMNSAQAGKYVLPVALVGRVPCQVIGTIAKGDRLVASDYMGAAQRLDPDQYQPGCIVGKALENYDSETIGLIEVAVGRT
jgi:hypothetical protein